jgi:hypothetical protein
MFALSKPWAACGVPVVLLDFQTFSVTRNSTAYPESLPDGCDKASRFTQLSRLEMSKLQGRGITAALKENVLRPLRTKKMRIEVIVGR